MARVLRTVLLTVLALVLLAVIAALFYIQTPTFDRWIRDQIIAQLENRFAVTVKLEKADLDLWDTRVQLYGLKIFNRSFPTEEPAIDVARAFADFTLLDYLSPSADLHRVSLEQPRLHILEDPNRSLNLTNMFVRRGRPGRGDFFINLAIDEVTIRKGAVVYEDRPFYVDAPRGSLEVSMKFVSKEQKYEGEAAFAGLNLNIDGFGLQDTKVQLQFDYLADQFRFQSIVLDSEEIDARAVGTISSLRDFRFRFETDVSVEVAKVRKPDLSAYFDSGTTHFSGIFSGSGRDVAFEGRASAAFLRVQGLAVRSLDSQILATREHVRVLSARFNFYDGKGEASGRLGWTRETLSQFDLSTERVDLRPLLLDLGRGEVQAYGRAAFQGTVSWPGLYFSQIRGSGQTTYQGDFLPPESPYRTVPFSGRASLSFEPGLVHFFQGLAQTFQSTLQYSGTVHFTGSYELDVAVNSERGNELVQLAQSFGFFKDVARQYPTEIEGPTELSGKLSGRRGDFQFSGALQARQIVLRDRLLGDFQSRLNLNPSFIQLRDAFLQGPGYSLSGSGRIPLGKNGVPASLDLSVNRLPLEHALIWLNRRFPVRGWLSGNLQMEEIAPYQYRGAGRLALTEGVAYEEKISRLTSNISFQGSRVVFDDMRLAMEGGAVTGDASIDLKLKTYSVDLNGENIPLEQIHNLQVRAPLRGRVNVSLQGSGHLQDPAFILELFSREVRVRQYVLGEITLHAEGKNQRAVFQLRNTFQGNQFLSEGSIGLLKPYPLIAALELNNTPIAPFLSLFPIRQAPDVDGSLLGTVNVTGPLAEPAKFTGRGRLSRLQLSLSGYEIRNREAVELVYRDGVMNVSPVTLAGRDTELHVSGNIRFAAPRNVNLKIEGLVNLVVLNSFIRPGSAAGAIQLQTTVFGALERPRIVGSAELKQGFLSHPRVPTTLAEVEGSFKFTANQVSIDRFTARTVHGQISADGGVFLEGFRPRRWRINVIGSGLRVEYPAQVVSLIDADLDLINSGRSQLISGVVYVRAADYTEELTVPELILMQSGAAIPASPGVRGEAVVLNIDVEAYRSIRVSNNLAEILASGDFTLRGTLQNPVILGRLIIEEGTLFLENNEYEITHGDVSFNNPRRTTAVLNFEAETEVREFTVSVLVRGPFEHLNTSFRSDPPMSTASIVTLLAIGQTQEEIFGLRDTAQPELGSLAFYGASALLSKSVGEQLESRTSRLFGFDKFSIDPFMYGDDPNPAARITLGKQLTKDFAVTYSTVLGNEQQAQIVALEYTLTSWLTAVGTREADGSIAIDFKLKKRF
ncbi:MAG: translocation/assembly module TamB domain-containing protein [Acidobacteria bacterium]|nr:translocation/assembly module TamB domain-containing protein [Acidobacteriota bacterium]